MNRNYEQLHTREVRYLLNFLLDHLDGDHKRKLSSELPTVAAKLNILNLDCVRVIANHRLDEIEADPDNCRVSKAYELQRVKRIVGGK